MNDKFPFRITDNVTPPINKGGTGQYMWVLNATDQTVTIYDLSGTPSVTATVSLTASKAICSGCYRPIDKRLYMFGSTGPWYDVIDLDPSSGTFATLLTGASLSGIVSTGLTNNAIVYEPIYDLFFVGNTCLRGDSITTVLTLNKSIAYPFGVGNLSGFAQPYLIPSQRICGTQSGGSSGNPFRYTRTVDGLDTETLGNIMIVGANGPGQTNMIAVNDFVYRGALTSMYKATKKGFHSVVNSALTTSMSGNWGMAYAPNARKFFIGRKDSAAIPMNVFDESTFTNIGSFDRTANKDTNEDRTREILYNPYDGYIYVKGGGTSATGITKMHRLDPTQSLGSMYVDALTCGNMGQTGINDGTFGFDFTLTHEYFV